MTAAVSARGYDLVGDLDDLAVAEQAGADAQSPSQQDVLDAALDALAGMVKIAPMPAPQPQWSSAARNVVRKARRRAVGVRNRVRQSRARRGR